MIPLQLARPVTPRPRDPRRPRAAQLLAAALALTACVGPSRVPQDEVSRTELASARHSPLATALASGRRPASPRSSSQQESSTKTNDRASR